MSNCKVCGGTGVVQVATNARGIKICEFCHGTGRTDYVHNICLEPLILEREEFEESEWAMCKKLFGFNDGQRVTRIKVNIDSVGAWIDE